MVYVAGWILFIPVLYVVYYSDLRNGEQGKIYSHKKKAFLWAVSGPIGLTIYLTCCLLGLITIILRTGQLGNPFKIFPLHSPWEEDK